MFNKSEFSNRKVHCREDQKTIGTRIAAVPGCGRRIAGPDIAALRRRRESHAPGHRTGTASGREELLIALIALGFSLGDDVVAWDGLTARWVWMPMQRRPTHMIAPRVDPAGAENVEARRAALPVFLSGLAG